MANSNPSPATRFGADDPGRAKQKGARDRLSTAFLTAQADDFEQHGAEVVAAVRHNDPSTYLGVFASVTPKELEVGHHPLKGMSDAQLAEVIAVITAALAAKAQAEAPDFRTVN